MCIKPYAAQCYRTCARYRPAIETTNPRHSKKGTKVGTCGYTTGGRSPRRNVENIRAIAIHAKICVAIPERFYAQDTAATIPSTYLHHCSEDFTAARLQHHRTPDRGQTEVPGYERPVKKINTPLIAVENTLFGCSTASVIDDHASSARDARYSM
jgi:hypothetical protein